MFPLVLKELLEITPSRNDTHFTLSFHKFKCRLDLDNAG